MTSGKPIIGVTSFVEEARWGHWRSLAALTPFAYVRAVATAGGRIIQLPADADAVDATLDRIDGLVSTGGVDLDLALYGGEEHATMAGVRPEQDQAELALLERALERDIPVLAICRGSQLLNVLRGGDIVQDVTGGSGWPELHGDGTRDASDHDVEVRAGSRLAQLLGRRAVVTCEHHQSFGRIGADLDETACAEDGLVEALEDPRKRFALVDEARRYRGEQGP